MKYCCDSLGYYIKKSTEIEYSPVTRSYSLILNYDEDNCTHAEIRHCPWCGKRFPDSLNLIWSKILREEYGINDPIKHEFEDGTTIGTEIVPEEFNTDEWWKKRGL